MKIIVKKNFDIKEIECQDVQELTGGMLHNIVGDLEDVEEIKISGGVTKISGLLRWDALFQNCKNLKRVELPDTLEIIGDYTFNGCTSLTEIVLPKNVKQIGKWAFEGCTNLKHVTLPEELYEIDHSAFLGCANLQDISIPEKTKIIGPNAFKDCKKIKNISLPKDVEDFGLSVIEGCEGIEKIEFPENYRNYIILSSLDKFVNLKSVKIPLSANIAGNVSLSTYNSIELVDNKYLVLSKELKKSNNACNLFKTIPGLDIRILFQNAGEIPEIIESVNKLSEDIVIPGSSIYEIDVLKTLLKKDYKAIRNLTKLIPEENREMCLPELYKLASVMGALEKKEVTIKANGKEIPVRDVAYTVLQGAINKNVITPHILHSYLGTIPYVITTKNF